MKTLQLFVLSILLGSYRLPAANAPPGQVIGWGSNNSGEAKGIPSGGSTNVVVTIDGQALSNIVSVAGGSAHGLALKADGTVVAWGWNYYGQATVPAGLSNVMAISAGENFSVALKHDGRMVAWGENADLRQKKKLRRLN